MVKVLKIGGLVFIDFFSFGKTSVTQTKSVTDVSMDVSVSSRGLSSRYSYLAVNIHIILLYHGSVI